MKKTYAELDAQIAALLKQKEEMAQQSADALTKAVMGHKEAAAALSGLTAKECRNVARLVASNIPAFVAQVKAAAQPPAEAPAAPAENAAPVVPTMPPTVAAPGTV